MVKEQSKRWHMNHRIVIKRKWTRALVLPLLGVCATLGSRTFLQPVGHQINACLQTKNSDERKFVNINS